MADALTMLGLTASDTVNALDVPSELEKTRASDLLAKIEAEMPWSEHWECRNCRRVVDAMTGCLKVSGRRAGAFLADEAAVSVSQRCFDLSEKLEERQTLFDEMRDDFQRMVCLLYTSDAADE